MLTMITTKLSPPNDLRAARLDRQAHFAPPARGFQLGLSLFDAAVKNQNHSLAEKVGQSAKMLTRG